MTDRNDFKEPIKTYAATLLQDAVIEVLHSEYRDENVKGKYYAYLCSFDSTGSKDDFLVTDDYDTPQEAINELKQELKTAYRKLLLKDIDKVK